jgi:hypothetical protein
MSSSQLPIRAGMRFRLIEQIFAIELTENECQSTYIPKEEIVDVVASPDELGLVEVRWKNSAFVVFVPDLQRLGRSDLM